MGILKADIVSELDICIEFTKRHLSESVKSESITKQDARKRYDAICRAKDIVIRWYDRMSEDIKLVDELNKPEILNEMINKKPEVVDLFHALKLKSE